MKYIIAILIFLFPTPMVRWLLNHSRCYNIARDVKVGFSFILANEIRLDDGVRIGSANLIKVERINVRGGGKINNLNFIRGNFVLHILENGRIGNSNKISTATKYHYHDVHMVVGKGSSVINGNLFDVTDSIFIGNNTVFAGTATQIWTHSGFRSATAHKRLDSPVYIGDNCYIGARCCITPGITIGDNIVVGAQTCVSKSLDKAGMYVSQPMRYLEFDADEKIASIGEPVCAGFICRIAANEQTAKERLGIE